MRDETRDNLGSLQAMTMVERNKQLVRMPQIIQLFDSSLPNL